MARKMKTMDGNNAAAYASYPFTDVAAIYPITPSSEIMEYLAKRMPTMGRQFVQSESELSAINMVMGAAACGARDPRHAGQEYPGGLRQ